MLGDYNHEKDLFTMFEVHPLKYGSMWQVPSKMLFESMVDPDGLVSRSRGFLVFTNRISQDDATDSDDPQNYTREVPVPRILQNCFSLSASKLACSHQPDEFEDATHEWLKHFIEVPRMAFGLNRNNSGIGAIALAITALSRQYVPNPEPTLHNCITGGQVATYGSQYIIRLLKIPITQVLGEFQTSASIESYLRRTLDEMKLDEHVDLSITRLEKCKEAKEMDQMEAGKMLYERYFKDNLMHTKKFNDASSLPSLILMKINVNVVFGGSIMPQNLNQESNALDTEMQNGNQWVVVAGVDNSIANGDDTYGDLIITSANMSRMGSFLRCKLENLCEAVEDNWEILILKGKE